MDLLQYNLDQLERWFLMMFRNSAMFIAMPFFGYVTVPANARLALAFFITSLLFPLYAGVSLDLPPGILGFFAIVLQETVIGLAIGFSTSLVFWGVMYAGQAMGHTMGFAIANVMDPQSQANVPILGQLLYLMMLMVFLTLGGHHFLIYAIDESFRAVPIGVGTFHQDLVTGIARMSADIFVIGVKLAAPVLVTIIVSEVALGIVARTVPQMNVWLVGFPLKIGIGLFTLSLTLPMMVYLFGKIFHAWQGDVIDFIRIFAAG